MSACAVSPAVRLREASFKDHWAISALESSGGLKPRSYNDWRRLWKENPTYRELGRGWPIGWVLETSGGRVVGALSNIPLTYEFEGRKLLVAAGRGWTVEEAYRSYALLLMDQYFDQPSVDIFLNTTVNAQAAEAFSVFGSRPVPVGDWGAAAFYVTSHLGFAHSALRIKGWKGARVLSYAVGLALWAKHLAQAKRRRASGIDVVIGAGFDHRFDAFWEKLRASTTALLGVRTRESLAWHFGAGGQLDRDRLMVLTATRNGVLRAYAVFQRKDEARYGLKRMRLVDFQALDSHTEYGEAMLETALAECTARGIHTLEQVGDQLPNTEWFERYAQYRRKLPHWSSYYFAPDAELAGKLENPGAWSPSAFDGDASL